MEPPCPGTQGRGWSMIPASLRAFCIRELGFDWYEWMPEDVVF